MDVIVVVWCNRAGIASEGHPIHLVTVQRFVGMDSDILNMVAMTEI